MVRMCYINGNIFGRSGRNSKGHQKTRIMYPGFKTSIGTVTAIDTQQVTIAEISTTGRVRLHVFGYEDAILLGLFTPTKANSFGALYHKLTH